jgi:DNA-binding SARP family transcriptional activator
MLADLEPHAGTKADLEFRILGPLEVLADGSPMHAQGSKQRSLIAPLVLHANSVVSTDRLNDELWAGERPVGRRSSGGTGAASLLP